MTDNERELMIRTAMVVGQIVSMGGTQPEMLAAFTKAMKNMEGELVKNNDHPSLLKPVLGETKQ